MLDIYIYANKEDEAIGAHLAKYSFDSVEMVNQTVRMREKAGKICVVHENRFECHSIFYKTIHSLT